MILHANGVSRHGLAALLFGAALFMGTGTALAEPSADERALARTLFEDGRSLLKAGNFKDRKDAEAYQKRIGSYFPKGVFIMKDIIEVKPGKPGEEEINP